MRINAPGPDQIGAEIVEFRSQDCTPEDARRILAAVYAHKLVVFRGQRLSNPEYVAFARQLGQPQVYFQPNYHHPDHPEIFVSANVKLDGKKVGVAGTGRYWHTDYQFMPEPLPLTMVYPQQWSREARGTHYIDMARVLTQLPAELSAQLHDRRAVQEGKWRYKVQEKDIDRSLAEIMEEIERTVPASVHPAIITHPVTGVRSLYVSSGFTTGFQGLSEGESKRLLSALVEHTERPENVHTQVWDQGDLLLWDNRTLIHKASATPPGEPSVSFRIGVYDGQPFYRA